MASARFWAGDYTETLAVLARSQLLSDIPFLRDTPGMDFVGQALTLEGLASFQCGDFRRTQLVLQQLCQRVNDPHSDALRHIVSLLGAVWLTFLLEERQQTKALAARLITLAQAHQLEFYCGMGKLFYSYVAHLQKEDGPVEKDIHDCYQTYFSVKGECLFHGLYVWLSGEILLVTERPADCIALLAQTLPVVTQGESRAFISELFELQARAKAQAEGHIPAEQAYRQALSTAELLGAIPAQINASVGLNHILAALGRPLERLQLAQRMQNVVSGESEILLMTRAQQILNN